MKSLLVLTDFSRAADRALAQAEVLGRRFGAEIHLFHKVTYPLPHPPTELLDKLNDAAGFEDVMKDVIERPEREAREELERRRAALAAAGVQTLSHLERSGDVYERVERVIETLNPDLVVMGTHGRSGLSKWLMGSVAERVLRHARVDVLTLHEDSPVAGSGDGSGEILVATDFSDCARRALASASRLASALGGTICLLHVVERRYAPRGEPGGAELVELSEDLKERSRRALRAELGDREGEVHLVEGHVAREIERMAEERDSAFVVLGTHGRSGIERALIGSVAEKVARSCRRPVLTVR